MDNIIPSPFGDIRYFNTDDLKLVQSSVSRMYKMADARKNFESSKVAAFDSTAKTFTAPKNARHGLFYFSRDFAQVYIQSFSTTTAQLDFGYHRDYFKELVQCGFFTGSDFEAYPRGFSVYDALSGLYMIVCGSWLEDAGAIKLCNAFEFDSTLPYVIVPNPAYDYQNNGTNAGKPYPWVK